ncbi:CHRD domain-containing protein, partial [Zoogloea sp. 1C4]|uniref:CHRD domain-containing protein n=1 Tax=Zoogloea sp. 1C4 TaxID=2570190 RepID=UPI00188543FB
MSLLQNAVRCGVAGVLALSAPLAGASLVSYSTILSGAAEAPPNASAGFGAATLLVDTTALTMTLDVSFGGLTGNVTASHIHCCTPVAMTGTAGVATQVPTFVGFPSGVTAGIYHQVFDLTLASTWNPTLYCVDVRNRSFSGLCAGPGLHTWGAPQVERRDAVPALGP